MKIKNDDLALNVSEAIGLEAIIEREANRLVQTSGGIPSVLSVDAAVRTAPDYEPVLDNVPGFTQKKLIMIESCLEELSKRN